MVLTTRILDKIGTTGIFPDDGKIRLVYTGRIYAEKQDCLQLLKALAILKGRGIPLQEKLEVLFTVSSLNLL